MLRSVFRVDFFFLIHVELNSLVDSSHLKMLVSSLNVSV